MPAVRAPDAAIFIIDLDWLLAADAPVAHHASIIISRSRCSIARLTERATVVPTEVAGRYVPPAKECPHLAHLQIPVPTRRTDGEPHWVHTCFSCIFPSMSATFLRMFLPYRTPNLPADLVFQPFVCLTIFITLPRISFVYRLPQSAPSQSPS